jgi:hypothetical protein
MSDQPKKPKRKQTNTPSLSSTELKLEEVREHVFSSLNNKELEKALDKWLKDNSNESKIISRDLTILKTLITEYLDTFLLFGYNPEGDRIIIQNLRNARDKDALMEFMKTIFIKQQHENFLDSDE